MRLGDRLDGHLVQGHVDGVGHVRAARPEGESTSSRSPRRPALLRYVVEKGSITVDGVSLTVAGAPSRRLHGGADPPHDGGHDARPAGAREAREPGGRRGGKIRGIVGGAVRAGRDVGDDQHRCRVRDHRRGLEEIRAGRMVVILDSEDRENEGDLVMAAQYATPEAINFMATHGRGLICLALTEARCDQLGLQAGGEAQRGALRDRLHRADRGPPRHHDRDLRAGPLAHDHGRDRPRRRPRRPGQARPRLPAARPVGRRAAARRPHRGGGRPRPPRRADPRGRDLRDQQPRRHDGPRAGAGARTRPSTGSR